VVYSGILLFVPHACMFYRVYSALSAWSTEFIPHSAQAHSYHFAFRTLYSIIQIIPAHVSSTAVSNRWSAMYSLETESHGLSFSLSIDYVQICTENMIF